VLTGKIIAGYNSRPKALRLAGALRSSCFNHRHNPLHDDAIHSKWHDIPKDGSLHKESFEKIPTELRSDLDNTKVQTVSLELEDDAVARKQAVL